MFVLIHTLVLHIVLRKMIHVGFVEHYTNDSLMQIRCRIERMPHNLDLCTAPFERLRLQSALIFQGSES